MTTMMRESEGTYHVWYEEAKKQTPETIGAWLAKFTDGTYGYDYGTICHAMAAAAIGAAWAVERGPGGGITGFQAGAVMWQFVRYWDAMGTDGPMRLLKFEDVLYPQYEHGWNAMSADTWRWVQEEAAKLLAGDRGAEGVRAHWQSIVDGIVPFGLRVEE